MWQTIVTSKNTRYCKTENNQYLRCSNRNTKQQDPLSAFLMLSRGKQSNMPGITLAAGVARKIAKLQSDCLWGSTQVFIALNLEKL